jgi:quercetin dioxygenase-like cupin family protein
MEGRGMLNLSGQDIALEPGVFVFMPANASLLLSAIENLTFLLALSEKNTRKSLVVFLKFEQCSLP